MLQSKTEKYSGFFILTTNIHWHLLCTKHSTETRRWSPKKGLDSVGLGDPWSPPTQGSFRKSQFQLENWGTRTSLCKRRASREMTRALSGFCAQQEEAAFLATMVHPRELHGLQGGLHSASLSKHIAHPSAV